MLLEVQHVRKEFQNRTLALTDASFSVSQGDFVSVIGPSGAGKTTLFRILNGSLRCDGGAILVNGIHFESADRRTRRAIQTTIGTKGLLNPESNTYPARHQSIYYSATTHP